jgi:hypothetical protein
MRHARKPLRLKDRMVNKMRDFFLHREVEDHERLGQFVRNHPVEQINAIHPVEGALDRRNIEEISPSDSHVVWKACNVRTFPRQDSQVRPAFYEFLHNKRADAASSTDN